MIIFNNHLGLFFYLLTVPSTGSIIIMSPVFIFSLIFFTPTMAVLFKEIAATAPFDVKNIREKIKTGDIIIIDPVDGTVRR